VAYDNHCCGIRDSFAPAEGMEADLVQSIADDRWRLKRAAIENSIFAIGLGGPDKVTAHHEEIDTALAEAQVWMTDSKRLALLTLYENRIQRRVEKNLQILHQMQQDRKAALDKAVEEADLLAQLAASKGEAYDIERDFPRAAHPRNLIFHSPKSPAWPPTTAVSPKPNPKHAPRKSLRHAA
jgi:hypothetical protein